MTWDAESGRRGSIVLGTTLVVIGILAIVARQAGMDVLEVGWPVFILVPGIVLFAGAVAVGGKPGIGLAIPGAIVTMTGIVLAFQNLTDAWATWAYAWALVAPGGVGIGLFLYGLVTGQRDVARAGLPVLLVGVGLFLGFGFFFEAVFQLSGGRFGGFDIAFAAGLVVLGLVVIGLSLAGRREPPA